MAVISIFLRFGVIDYLLRIKPLQHVRAQSVVIGHPLHWCRFHETVKRHVENQQTYLPSGFFRMGMHGQLSKILPMDLGGVGKAFYEWMS